MAAGVTADDAPERARAKIETILTHLRAGDDLETITARTGIGGVNSDGRRTLRRWLARHGRSDLWEWIRENSRPWSNTWKS
jgi:hypothetical protein